MLKQVQHDGNEKILIPENTIENMQGNPRGKGWSLVRNFVKKLRIDIRKKLNHWWVDKQLDRKKLRHLYLCLCLMAIFNFYRYLGVFAAAVIFLFGRYFFTEFAGNLVAEHFYICQLSSAKV